MVLKITCKITFRQFLCTHQVTPVKQLDIGPLINGFASVFAKVTEILNCKRYGAAVFAITGVRENDATDERRGYMWTETMGCADCEGQGCVFYGIVEEIKPS